MRRSRKATGRTKGEKFVEELFAFAEGRSLIQDAFYFHQTVRLAFFGRLSASRRLGDKIMSFQDVIKHLARGSRIREAKRALPSFRRMINLVDD